MARSPTALNSTLSRALWFALARSSASFTVRQHSGPFQWIRQGAPVPAVSPTNTYQGWAGGGLCALRGPTSCSEFPTHVGLSLVTEHHGRNGAALNNGRRGNTFADIPRMFNRSSSKFHRRHRCALPDWTAPTRLLYRALVCAGRIVFPPSSPRADLNCARFHYRTALRIECRNTSSFLSGERKKAAAVKLELQQTSPTKWYAIKGEAGCLVHQERSDAVAYDTVVGAYCSVMCSRTVIAGNGMASYVSCPGTWM